MAEKLRQRVIDQLRSNCNDYEVSLPYGRSIPVLLEDKSLLIDFLSIEDSVKRILSGINTPLLNKVTAFFIGKENIPNPHDPNTFCTGYRRRDWLRENETVIQLYPFAFEKRHDHEGLSGIPRSSGAVIHEIGHELDRFPEQLSKWCSATGWIKLAKPEVITMQDGTQMMRKYSHDPSQDQGEFPTKYASYSPTDDFSESLVAFLYNCQLSLNRKNFLESF